MAIPLIIMCGRVVEWETNKTLCNTKDELKAGMIPTFTNLNKETVYKACRRFRSRLEAVVGVNSDIIEWI